MIPSPPPDRSLSESDICDQFITPAIVGAGWDLTTQIRREYSFTAGRVTVRGQTAKRGPRKRADYLLSFQPNLPLAVVEAKGPNEPIGGGMQQALGYAESLQVPFVFTSNGSGFIFHDRTGNSNPVERQIALGEFPSPVFTSAVVRTMISVTGTPPSLAGITGIRNRPAAVEATVSVACLWVPPRATAHTLAPSIGRSSCLTWPRISQGPWVTAQFCLV